MQMQHYTQYPSKFMHRRVMQTCSMSSRLGHEGMTL